VNSAIISSCGQYRYHLHRRLDDEGNGRVVFVMLNPSTADAEQDDPTIRRCIGFAKREGASILEVVNLYALRSTNWKALCDHHSPIGIDNDDWITRIVNHNVNIVIAAWGAHPYKDIPFGRRRAQRVAELIPKKLLKALHVTKSGAPGHPLYLPANAPLRSYTEV
jgi:hypothetical protein